MHTLPPYQDRADAGARLLSHVRSLDPRPDLVLGLSGGGIEVAAPIARALDLPLHIAVIESGGGTLRRLEATSRMRAAMRETAFLSAAANTTAAGRARYEADIEDLEARHAAHHALPEVDGRHVLLVDDGLHPDTLTLEALHALRGAGAATVALATPLLTRASRARMEPECDTLIALQQPDEFGAATDFYVDPSPPTPEAVRRLLDEGTRPGTG